MAAKSKVGRRAAANRRGAARSASAPAQQVLDRLARELLGICGNSLMRLGADPGRSAIRALRHLPHSARYAARMHVDADKLSLINTRWQRQTGYFDEDGHPKLISVSGPAPSYQALCTDCGLATEWQRLLKLALTLHMCSRVGRAQLANLADIALFTGSTPFVLARAVVNIERFLKSTEYNATPGRKVSESLVDRTAVVNLSEAEFRDFSTAMRSILHDFVEASDRRLLAGVSRDESQPKKQRLQRRLSGVSAFVFRD